MKRTRSVYFAAALLALSLVSFGQAPPETVRILPPGVPVAPPAPQVPPGSVVAPQLTESQINDLTACIALYPDALLAEMLPASTSVEEVTYADRWVEQHPGAEESAMASLPVDASVKFLMHYPTVLKMLAEHVDWTQSLGMAFAYQRPQVMGSVQQWRATAVASGHLFSTPQQDVLKQGAVILIQPPAQAKVLYVPTYDPAVVYLKPTGGRPVANAITFGTDGIALTLVQNDLDWRVQEVHVPHTDPQHGSGARVVFEPSGLRPGAPYPARVLTPQQDRKVLMLGH